MRKNVELLNCSPSAPGWDNNVIMRKSETTIKFCINFLNNTVTAGNGGGGANKRVRHKSMYKLLLGIMLDQSLGDSLISERWDNQWELQGWDSKSHRDMSPPELVLNYIP